MVAASRARKKYDQGHTVMKKSRSRVPSL